MPVRVQWTGLDEMRAALRALPQTLATEATHIVEAAANSAAREIKARYPRKSGNLSDHLTLTPEAVGPFGVAYRLQNTAKHAWIYESGTELRYTVAGVPRGRMPASHVFLGGVLPAKRRMNADLQALLERHGFLVHEVG